MPLVHIWLAYPGYIHEMKDCYAKQPYSRQLQGPGAGSTQNGTVPESYDTVGQVRITGHAT